MDSDIIEISSFDDKISGDFFADSPTASASKSSSNFGSGIELLMNEKKKEGGSRFSSDIDIEDLNNLESELNNLTSDNDIKHVEHKSDLFNRNISFDDNRPSVRFDESSSNINIGQATAESGTHGKTWDGYGKFNEIPVNPEKTAPSHPQMSKEELLREKFKCLRKLEMLETKGVTLTKKYNMESNLAEMQGEYETIMEEKAKQNSVKFQGNMLMTLINGIEFLNNRFDPFDVKLDGWGEQINENINDYDDVFAELYDKYKTRASMAPELKLLFQLGGSAMMVHMTNTMFKSAMPNVDDIFRQNPDLMRHFQTAAVNSMGQTNPGFSDFMNGVMNNEPKPDSRSGPPPPPVSGQNYEPSSNRYGNNEYGSNKSSLRQSNKQNENDGINIRENRDSRSSLKEQQSRVEMKGPSDISDLLSRLKTKTINIQDNSNNNNTNNNNNSINDSSTISISELKELQSDGVTPKRSKRRQKSDRNTLSLDI